MFITSDSYLVSIWLISQPRNQIYRQDSSVHLGNAIIWCYVVWAADSIIKKPQINKWQNLLNCPLSCHKHSFLLCVHSLFTLCIFPYFIFLPCLSCIQWQFFQHIHISCSEKYPIVSHEQYMITMSLIWPT